MHKRLNLFAAAAILAFSPLASARASDLPGPTVPQGWGINIHFTDPQPGEMARFREAGFGFARMDFQWAAIERVKGVYDFAAYDRLYKTLADVGTRPIFILDYGNDLYQRGSPSTPEAREAFARFAAAAAQHFADRRVVWEIWNEPNIGFWKPAPNAAEYAALAVAAAHAIHAAVPSATVIAPGSSTFPWDFLETAFKAGLLNEIDGVSVHPYRSTAPETASADFARLRVLIARYAPKGREYLPIVASEWGYSTVAGGTTEDVQAAYIAREWLANMASGVDLTIFYDWRNDGDDPKEKEHRFGTVKRDFTPKPSFLEAKKLITDLYGYTFRHRLAGKDDTDWRLLFQKADTDDIAVVSWTADSKASIADQTPVTRHIAPADRDYLGLRRLAAIHLEPSGGIMVRTSDNAPVNITFSVHNSLSGNASVETTVSEPLPFPMARLAQGVPPPSTRAAIRARIPAGTYSDESITVPRSPLRNDSELATVSFTWSGTPLPAIAPVAIRRTDPLVLAAAPAGKMVRIGVENPGDGPFEGAVVLKDKDSKAVRAAPILLPRGTLSAQVDLPMPSDTLFSIELRNLRGEVVAQTGSVRFQPLEGFLAGRGSTSDYKEVRFIENASQPSLPLVSIKTPDGSPAPKALRFAYTFEPGWRFTEIASETPLTIPPGAKALSLWIWSDGSGDALRSRFKDATGQTFQPDMGRLDWKGWKLVTIPLDGVSSTGHWGGVADGGPTGALTWEALLLIDSMNKVKSHGGEMLIASPAYVFGS